MPSQYGDDALIEAYFGGKRGGFVVDVGAADGVVNSNSHRLLTDLGWSGILIDPLPEHVDAMRQTYDGRDDVTIVRCAVAREPGTIKMWPGEQGTTAIPEWRDRLAEYHGTQYGEPFEIDARPLTDILDQHGAPSRIDFLTVDCEGMDTQVLQSLDWDRYAVSLVCVEASNPWPSLIAFMKERGLGLVGQTAGNALFGRANCG